MTNYWNGASVLTKTLTTVFAAWLLAFSVFALKVYAHVNEPVSQEMRDYMEESFARKETISVQMRAIQRQLDRIEEKLDKHLEDH